MTSPPAAASRISARRAALLAAIALAVGVGARLGTDRLLDEGRNDQQGVFPEVAADLPDHEYVHVVFVDPDAFGGAEMQMTSSLVEPLIAGTLTDGGGELVRFQVRGDEFYALPAGSSTWVATDGARFADLGDLVAQAMLSIDQMVPPRIRPFVEVVDERVEILAVNPIGSESVDEPFSGAARLETRRFELRLDRAALAETDPMAAWDAGYFGDDGQMTLSVDERGFIRQLVLDEVGASVLRIVGTASSAPPLERDLDVAGFVPLDEIAPGGGADD